jgi:hypothetical protein
MPSASAPASMGSVAAMLTPARTLARLDLMELPVRFVASDHSTVVTLSMNGSCQGNASAKKSPINLMTKPFED